MEHVPSKSFGGGKRRNRGPRIGRAQRNRPPGATRPDPPRVGATKPSGVVLEHTYDGMLLTGMTWSGAVNGAVAFGYDNSFRVTSETVSAGGTVSPMVFGYDPDDIVICASPSTCSPAGADALEDFAQCGKRARDRVDARGGDG